MVLSLANHGSLADYLKTNTLSWSQLCGMLENISQGVSHLHSDSSKRKSVEHRASICHRDINTRNILVRSDLSCCLSDFGFSLKISGSNYFTAGGTGETICAESRSLSDVGTVRYIAPELLEGVLNLRDCESSLKQVDVYAMGLTFWEVARRCKDLYQGAEVPGFSLAFESELGHQRSPTFEQMKILVARNKARPLFPSVWKDSNPALQLLRETIEYCWDQDGEAR